MDNNRLSSARLSSAYSSLKMSQQRLGELSAGLDEPAKSRMSEVLATMLHAQDDLIVLRENMQSLEFDNAALRQKLKDRDREPSRDGPAPFRDLHKPQE